MYLLFIDLSDFDYENRWKAAVMVSRFRVSENLCGNTLNASKGLKELLNAEPVCSPSTVGRSITFCGIILLSYYATILARCRDICLSFDGSSFASRTFFIVRIGGVTPDNKRIYFPLSLSEIIEGGGTETEFQSLIESLRALQRLQQFLNVRVIKTYDIVTATFDNTSSNTGVHRGLVTRLESERYKDFLVDFPNKPVNNRAHDTTPPPNYQPLIGLSCMDHITSIALSEATKRLTTFAIAQKQDAFIDQTTKLHVIGTTVYQLHSHLANNRQYVIQAFFRMFELERLPFTRIKSGRYIAAALACDVVERHYAQICLFLAFVYPQTKYQEEKAWLWLLLQPDFRAQVHLFALIGLVFRAIMQLSPIIPTLQDYQEFLQALLSLLLMWRNAPHTFFNLSLAKLEKQLADFRDNLSQKYQPNDNQPKTKLRHQQRNTSAKLDTCVKKALLLTSNQEFFNQNSNAIRAAILSQSDNDLNDLLHRQQTFLKDKAAVQVDAGEAELGQLLHASTSSLPQHLPDSGVPILDSEEQAAPPYEPDADNDVDKFRIKSAYLQKFYMSELSRGEADAVPPYDLDITIHNNPRLVSKQTGLGISDPGLCNKAKQPLNLNDRILVSTVLVLTSAIHKIAQWMACTINASPKSNFRLVTTVNRTVESDVGVIKQFLQRNSKTKASKMFAELLLKTADSSVILEAHAFGQTSFISTKDAWTIAREVHDRSSSRQQLEDTSLQLLAADVEEHSHKSLRDKVDRALRSILKLDADVKVTHKHLADFARKELKIKAAAQLKKHDLISRILQGCEDEKALAIWHRLLEGSSSQQHLTAPSPPLASIAQNSSEMLAIKFNTEASTTWTKHYSSVGALVDVMLSRSTKDS